MSSGTSSLESFVIESNRIEGILRDPTPEEIGAHEKFLRRRLLTVEAVEQFVATVAGVELRDRRGMDVRVGAHRPPPGAPLIRESLEKLLDEIQTGDYTHCWTPYEAHVAYEKLHPFMDGNGRSGRVLWAWHMRFLSQDPFALPFLHRFYYQTLDDAQS